MEITQIFSMFGIFSFVFMNRKKIYDKLSNSKIGFWVMSPIMVPYVMYGLIKLAKDDDFIMLITDAKRQKKLDEFL